MNGHQPEASTSTSSPPSKHCVSLVIDSELPREQYSRLIEAEGVVHSLVQRLLEKHGGDKHLLFDAQITPNIERHTLSTSSSTSRGQVNNLGFRQSSAFLASLPSLSRYLTLENESQLVWPGFLDTTTTTKQNREELPWETSKIKHRRRETCLLNGIVEGVETLSRRPRRDCSRRFIHSITPPEAASLLNQTLHPSASASSSSPKTESHYLIVLTSSISTDTAGDDWRALPTSNLDHEWDERSWREVGEGCMSKGIYASCIVAGREEDSELSRSLRILCQETSPNGFEEAWFDVPEDADVAISGFGIDPRTVPPSPSAQATSTSATEQIITPATNQTEQLPNLNAAKLQHAQNQMQTFRMIQAKAAESGNPLNAQAMSQLISALKSGNLDHNSAGMQQIKNLFSLQQQQKLGQASMNPAAAAAAMQAQGQGQGQGGGTDQLLLAAMRQQMLQQNQGQGQGQGQVNMGQNQQQQMQPQQQQQPQQRTQSGSQPQYPQQSQNQPQNQNQNQNHQQNQQQNRPNQVRVWSGSLIWNPNSTTRLALNLDANAVGGNPLTDYKPELWSKDLLISTITTCTFADLQNYSRTAKAPFAIFTPQSPASGGDTSNAIRYSNMAKSLHAGGQMALINFGNDRGLIIFTMLSNGESKSERLMALVCVNTPLPSLRGQQNQSGGDSNQNQNPNQNQTQSQNQNQNHQRSQSQQGQQQIQGTGNGNGLGLGIPSNLSQGQSISPSMINQQQQQQQNQQYPSNQQQQQQQQYNQQQQFNQQQQQQQQARIPVQQQPSQTQQYMLTPEQNQIFRQLVAQHNLNADVNFDPFNLDEGKYRQIMSLVNQANEQQRLVKQQQQLQQQMGVEGQMGMMQQQQQQQFGGQNGFQGMNMGGQGQGQGQGFQ